MRKIPVKIGEIYGKLTVLGEATTNKNRLSLRCECGTLFEATKGSVLSSGNTRSCGCARKETLVSMKTTHGMRQHPLYSIWAGMRKRCLSPKCKSYKDYGGRGITICSRWEDFSKFVEDMGSKPYDQATLDREDNNGNYEPGNCKWSTFVEQVTNQRKSLRYTYKNLDYTMAELAVVASVFGVSQRLLGGRISKGVAVHLAVETPKGKGGYFAVFTHKNLEVREGVKNLYPVAA